MIVDSCVWIDFFSGRSNAATTRLGDELRGVATILVGDLIRLEVLRGYRERGRAAKVAAFLDGLPHVDLLGRGRVEQVCSLDHVLQRNGLRMSTADLVIAAYCVAEKLPLLTRDKAFAAVAGLAGLRLVVPTGD